MYEVSDIRKGLRIEIDGTPYQVIDFQFVKPGKGNAFTRTKIRNMINLNVLDKTFKTGEKLKPADVEEHEMAFLYQEGQTYHFMSQSTYEQIELGSDFIGEASRYLQENTTVAIAFFNSKPIGITLPNFVLLEVIETTPGEKGNTVTGATKPATLSTKYEVNVPLFINEGDHLRIDTRTGEYIERVKV